jgi:hypothetical protein
VETSCKKGEVKLTAVTKSGADPLLGGTYQLAEGVMFFPSAFGNTQTF